MFRFAFKASSLIHSRNIIPTVQIHFSKKFYSSNAKTFDSMSIISQKTLDALEKEFKFKEMTEVQARVLELLPTDSDLLVRAKTGTGKTLAFLIAALESALARRNGEGLKGDNIPILIISPTRELALQIGEEACRLLYPHRYKVGVAVGGTSRNVTLKMFESQRVDLVVGTPGRLIDVLKSSEKGRQKVSKLDTVKRVIIIP